MIDLSKNENCYGVPTNISSTIKDVTNIHHYQNSMLKTKLMNKFNVSEKNIIVGNGSEDLLVQILLTLRIKHGKILLPHQTWPYYFEVLEKLKYNTSTFELENKPESFEYNVDHILKTVEQKKPKIILLTSPNNPTGNCLKSSDIKKIISAFKGIVILDQAYFGFTKEKDFGATLIKKYSNLVILRSFSKYYAIAGLRIGFALMSEALYQRFSIIERYLGINVVAEKTACKCLENESYFQKTAAQINRNKKELSQKLLELGHIVYKSKANFVLIKTKNATLFTKKLHDNGFLVKQYTYGTFKNHVRLTIGTKKECEKIVSILKTK